ncbi:MAG: sigma-70 family RNA polymerase sigma factor [Phycisphaeraceae bacterium]
MPQQPSDQHWLDRIRDGDTSAMGELLSAYQGRLFNVCLRMLSNRDDAAEATQEAMLKIIQHIDSFRGRSQLSTWMIRIAMNQATTRLRQRQRRPTFSLDGRGHANGRAHRVGGDDQASGLREVLSDSREPEPGAGVEKEELRRQLQTALGTLEEEFRAVLVLRDIDGMDYQQIADVLETPVGTVKSRLFRARLAMRQQLQAMEDRPRSNPASRPEVHDG